MTMSTDYRGATVEDLDRPPAVSVRPDTPLSEALALSFENEFSHLPVLDGSRRLLGFLTARELESRAAQAAPGETMDSHYHRFGCKRNFEVITPATPLERVEAFFARGNDFAVVTDPERKFVLSVVTPDDLRTFKKARP